MICEQAGHGGGGDALVALLARPFTIESCGAIKAELARVRALAMQARARPGSKEAAA